LYIFFQDQCKGLSNDEKYRLAGEAWKGLSSQDLNKYSSMSKEYAFPSLDKITDETKKKLISEHKKQMLEQVIYNHAIIFILTNLD